MKRSLLALAMASCASHAAEPTRPAEPRELRTALAPRAVGLVLEEDSRKIVEMTIAGKHGVERIGRRTRVRVMAVAGGKITQLATTYLEYVFDVRQGDKVPGGLRAGAGPAEYTDLQMRAGRRSERRRKSVCRCSIRAPGTST